MNWIIDKINKNIDKALHFLIGFFMYVVLYNILDLITIFNEIYKYIFCILLISVVAYYKEHKDINGTGFNYYDLIVTVIGALLALIII